MYAQLPIIEEELLPSNNNNEEGQDVLKDPWRQGK